MKWSDSPEQAEFRAEVRQFIRNRFPVGYAPARDVEQSVEPEDVHGYDWVSDRTGADAHRAASAREWAGILAERGWVAPRWPVEFGGAGMSVFDEFILREEMMRARVPTVNGLGVFLLGPTLLAHGTPEQRSEHLPPTARGDRIWAQGFSEPEAGSDLAGLRTSAVRDRDHYVVNGQKTWTSHAQHADWLFALVRTATGEGRPRHRGISFLLIDARSPGVTIRPITDIRGSRPFAEVFFDDVRVPVANRVGAENAGWYVAMDTLSFERSGIGASVKLEQIFTELVDCLQADHEGVYTGAGWVPGSRAELARRYADIRVFANLARNTLSAGAVPGYEASVSQLFGAELFQRLARTGLRALGRHSLLRRGEPEAPMGAIYTHLWLDSVAATFLGGTSDIQRTVIATRGLGLPRG